MIKYQACFEKIFAIEFLRETKKHMVVSICRHNGRLDERREAKIKDLSSWHDTWADAHAALIQRAQGEVDRLQYQLERANKRLIKRKAMKQ